MDEALMNSGNIKHPKIGREYERWIMTLALWFGIFVLIYLDVQNENAVVIKFEFQ